jgi:hypothetical protein
MEFTGELIASMSRAGVLKMTIFLQMPTRLKSLAIGGRRGSTLGFIFLYIS